jgi:hypothetical protein
LLLPSQSRYSIGLSEEAGLRSQKSLENREKVLSGEADLEKAATVGNKIADSLKLPKDGREDFIAAIAANKGKVPEPDNDSMLNL